MRKLLFCLIFLLPLPLAAQEQEQEQTDRGFIQGLLEDALSAPGRTVRIEGFAGALSSRATIDRITMSDPDGIWLTIDDVAMVWTRSALLGGRIEIDEISAASIDLPRLPLPAETELPEPEASGSFALPDLPVSVTLGELSFASVTLGEPIIGEAVELTVSGSAELSGGAGQAQLAVERQDKGGALRLQGAFDNASRVLGIDLSLSEPAGGIASTLLGLPGAPSVALQVQGEAPLSDYTATVRLETNDEERLAGQVQLLTADDGTQGFAVDISGDLAPVLAPQYRAFLGDRVALVTEGSRAPDGALSLTDLNLSADALTLTGAAQIGADGWPERFDLNGRIAAPEGGSVLLPLTGPETRISGATLSARFNAAEGEAWQLQALLRDLDRADLNADRFAIDGSGTISQADNNASGRINIDASGLAPADQALQQALGEQITGALDFDWTNGEPLRLTDLALSGEDYGLAGAITLDGITDSLNLRIQPNLTLRAEDLGRFSALSGLDLGGGARLDVEGAAQPLSGLIDVRLNGTTTDLATGIAQVDPLLDGQGTLTLSFTRDEQGTRIQPLRIETQAARIEAQGDIATGDADLTLTARVFETSDVFPGLEGPFAVDATATQTGTVWQINATGDAPGDARLAFDGTVSGGGAEEMTVAGTLDAAIQRLSVYSQFAGRDLNGALTVTARGTGAVTSRSFDVQASVDGSNLQFDVPQLDPLLRGPSQIEIDATRADGVMTIDSLFIDTSGFDASASGRIAPTGSAVNATVDMPDVGLALPGLNGPARIRVNAEQAGEIWQIDANGDLPGNASLSFNGAVSGDYETSLTIDGRLDAAVGRLAAFSQVAKRQLGGSVRLSATGSGDVFAQTFDIDATVDGTDLRVDVPQVDPLLRGASRIELRAARSEDVLQVDRLIVDTTGLGAELTGRLADSGSAVDFTADMPDVGLALPGLNGPGRVRGNAVQTGETWDIDVSGSIPGDAQLAFVGTLTGDLETSALVEGRLDASVGRLSAFSRIAGRPLGGAINLRAEGSGDALAQTFDLDASVNASALQTGIAQADALIRGTSTLDIRAARNADGMIRIDTATLDASGIDADVSGQMAANGGDVRFTVSLPDLGLVVPDLPGPARVSGTARSEGGTYSVDVNGTGPGGVTLDAAGTVAADVSSVNLTVNGVAPLALANARLRPRALDGLLRFDVAVNGPPALSSVTGTVSTDGARLVLPDLRNALDDIALRVRLGNSAANVEATARLATGGDLAVRGPIQLTAPFAADLQALLSNITLRQAGLFETTANGTVTVNGPLTGGARIGGTIGLEEVEARIPSFGPSYTVLEGLRHANPPADVLRTLQFAGLNANGAPQDSGPGVAFPLDLTINAPNRIFVRGRGLDAELGGSLRLTGTTADVVPQGQFDLIRGRLDLLGKRLQLTEGSIGLRGSFDPVIRLAATTDVDGTQITIEIVGPASDPDLRIASEPQLPEDEVLSLLLFGRSIQNISPLQAVQLAQAVRTLSGRGGGGILDSVRSGLNLDDLDIGTNADGTAQARVGAYISENIYTDVTVTADGESEINLNLDLRPGVTLRGSLGSDGDSGIGVFYEKDY